MGKIELCWKVISVTCGKVKVLVIRHRMPNYFHPHFFMNKGGVC
jgi:hypothetical protein